MMVPPGRGSSTWPFSVFKMAMALMYCDRFVDMYCVPWKNSTGSAAPIISAVRSICAASTPVTAEVCSGVQASTLSASTWKAGLQATSTPQRPTFAWYVPNRAGRTPSGRVAGEGSVRTSRAKNASSNSS